MQPTSNPRPDPPAPCMQGSLDPCSLVALSNKLSSGSIAAAELFLPLMSPFFKSCLPLPYTQPTHTQTPPYSPHLSDTTSFAEGCGFALGFLPAPSHSDMLQNRQHFAQSNVQGRTISFQAASEGWATSATTPSPCNSSALNPGSAAMPNPCFALMYSMHQWCLVGMGKGEDEDRSAASCFSFFPNFHLFSTPWNS